MLPSLLAGQLEKGFGDYLETTFPMSNEPFRGSIRKLLERRDSVYHEPYVCVNLPFRVAEAMPACFEAVHPDHLPYLHQQKAFERLCGDDGRSTLVATGTGSGKTECFLYPILDYCYRHRGERGIKALIIYPMNALALDQARRMAELIFRSPELRGNVSAGMYVGGREHAPSRVMSEHGVITDHDTLLNCPPDILLTNYKMLDYLLVRPKDARLWRDNGAETLKYVAVDELHTFDGAQGTDLACLLRRLKRRLGIYDGCLCCVGTSATLGARDSRDAILRYASEIFGEPFDKEALITEDRLSAGEFLAHSEITEFSLPDAEQTAALARLEAAGGLDAYLREAVRYWFPDFAQDALGEAGRLALGQMLMHHCFVHSVLSLTGGSYYQASKIGAELQAVYPQLGRPADASVLINSLWALISHARSGRAGRLHPFLQVQVQLWMRELRRLVAKVDAHEVSYETAPDLNSQQAAQYLPVINCRDCGMTGWVSLLNERGNAAITNMGAFYNLYFQADDRILMMFPHAHKDCPSDMIPAGLCPQCLQVKVGEEGADACPGCGAPMLEVLFPKKPKTTGSKARKQYDCPWCGSRRGLALMGLRAATAISAGISQLFASKFNDDKKALAFSDNVQDAAHRAGFFNSRTWRFGLRGAMQKYCLDCGSVLSLAQFQEGFIKYWHGKMTDAEFVSFFIAPNMTWRRAYEDMVARRGPGRGKQARYLMQDVERRLAYEIMLEYGLTGRIGRTLEKSGCSVMAFAPEDIAAMAADVRERAVNELGELSSVSRADFERMVLGWLNLMRCHGAFNDEVFAEYTRAKGNGYLLSNDRISWLPGRQSGRNIPRFVAVPLSFVKKGAEFDTPSSPPYVNWIVACAGGLMEEEAGSVSRFILEAGVKQKVISQLPSSPEYAVYGLDKGRVYISPEVVRLRCGKCGCTYAVAGQNAGLWYGAPCQRVICSGCLQEAEDGAPGYYGRLYSSGDLARINAREHTGLLERPERERLEGDFKRTKEARALWDPNVLSCTPTLEMGIDIGDLSSVILCSVPPDRSRFLQRSGRAGRRDGNALTLAVANARPHDLYFYADPLDMIAGTVVPPRIFLRASAVLARQFVAFCLDSWVKRGLPDGAVPDKAGLVLASLEAARDSAFPFNFLNYVQSTLFRQLNSFTQMFADSLDNQAREELQDFARGRDGEKSPMYVRILDAFQSLKRQQEALRRSVDTLKGMIKELQAKPQDSSYQKEIKELKGEAEALRGVLAEIDQKNIYNFLSDEGLLPNYAFPEAGIILRALLYRKEEEPDSAPAEGGGKCEKMVYEYSRSASSALSEFAPHNSFYVDGRKLKIDQVDLTTAQSARWRLCPNCDHARLEEAGRNVAACPRCGSPAWADRGQVRTMLKVQMVYSHMDYTGSLISDDSEDRDHLFYCRQLLVDVDEDRDIACAYRLDNDDFPFGYEFVRKAVLREINFGESDITGEELSVAGVSEARRGFKICSYCGKIQPENGPPSHTYACRAGKLAAPGQKEAYEECLFLYREFTTEVLRLLVPATTLDSTSVKLESFVAAFMLGMKEYFGNVDHLRATVSGIPVAGADFRKQYLVIYDSVPGGTGYLKQLMHEKEALLEIFAKALQVMENCPCRNDPRKDGCYHCLFAYRQSWQIGNISRTAATAMLKSILSGRHNIEKINRLNDIPVNPLFDSELEQRFLEAVRKRAGAANVSGIICHGRHGYYVKLGELAWELEPQVLLDAGSGVRVTCRPDFVFWPVKAEGHLPVAVFTDGFLYHKDIAADDTVKREAIRRSGRFRVWSLSYKDVQNVFVPQVEYATPALDAGNMPSGSMMYNNTLKQAGAEVLEPARTASFDLLFEYLRRPGAEKLFGAQAKAYALSLLDPKLMQNRQAFDSWKDLTERVKEQTCYTEADFTFPDTLFGKWEPRSCCAHLAVYAGIRKDALKAGRPVAVCALLEDAGELRTDKYEQEWNGFWQFCNVMQFAGEFMAVSSLGLEQRDYPVLSPCAPEVCAVPYEDGREQGAAWDGIRELLFDKEAQAFALEAQNSGVEAPAEEHIGYEVEGRNGEVIATVEMAWPGRKAAYMTEDQLEDKEKLISRGWRVFDALTIAEAVQYLGGKR